MINIYAEGKEGIDLKDLLKNVDTILQDNQSLVSNYDVLRYGNNALLDFLSSQLPIKRNELEKVLGFFDFTVLKTGRLAIISKSQKTGFVVLHSSNGDVKSLKEADLAIVVNGDDLGINQVRISGTKDGRLVASNYKSIYSGENFVANKIQIGLSPLEKSNYDNQFVFPTESNDPSDLASNAGIITENMIKRTGNSGIVQVFNQHGNYYISRNLAVNRMGKKAFDQPPFNLVIEDELVKIGGITGSGIVTTVPIRIRR